MVLDRARNLDPTVPRVPMVAATVRRRQMRRVTVRLALHPMTG